MTNPTPHGQVPEALRLADLLLNLQTHMGPRRPSHPDDAHCWDGYTQSSAELRRLHAENEALRAAHVQNPAEIEHVAGDVSKNGAELNVSTQQQECGNTPYDEGPFALAQPVAQRGAADGFFLLLPQRPKPEAPAGTAGLDWDAYSGAQMLAFGRDCSDAAIAAPAASPTPPAEQQATKETLGGVNGWRDISTAPKDGSRFVATGHNYGLYSEVRHTCVAQWFRGCWMEASDWNETSELKYLTHWMPLPSPPDDVAAPAEQQAAPKAAPGELAESAAKGAIMGAAYDFRDAHISGSMSLKRSAHAALEAAVDNALAAPKQEAQEPYAYAVYFPDQPTVELVHELDDLIDDLTNRPHVVTKLYTAPQPAPAPLSEMPYEKRKAIQEGEQIGASDAWFHARLNMLDTLDRRNVFRAGFDRGWNAALAAQGGKDA